MTDYKISFQTFIVHVLQAQSSTYKPFDWMHLEQTEWSYDAKLKIAGVDRGNIISMFEGDAHWYFFEENVGVYQLLTANRVHPNKADRSEKDKILARILELKALVEKLD